jgi:hypothetical protein
LPIIKVCYCVFSFFLIFVRHSSHFNLLFRPLNISNRHLLTNMLVFNH